MSDVMKKALSKRVRGLPAPAEAIPVSRVPDEILEGVRLALLAGETHYTDRPGIRELREKVAEKLGRSADEVVITTGESEARFVTRLALGHASEDVVVGNWDDLPGLSSFRVGFAAADRELATKIRSWKQALSICTAAPSQRAVLVALEGNES